MNHHDVGRFWNANAEAWTKLARAGYDVYRDLLNTPAFMALLPDVAGLAMLDIGCGEGHNTRLLAQRGARVTGIDIAEAFLAHAQAAEERQPLGIVYKLASAVELPFDDASFGAATAFMSLMDIGETDQVLAEAHRVLTRGGFLQFSITHPCFDTPHRRSVRDADGRKYALEVGDYFRNLNGEVTEWLFGAAPAAMKHGMPLFRTPRFTRTLGQWMNLLIDTGFIIERMGEPYPSDEAVRAYPRMEGARVVPDFLHVRVRKPA
jgi:ubiquinone/menaquinone biosynthesis C-methylase UbiE